MGYRLLFLLPGQSDVGLRDLWMFEELRIVWEILLNLILRPTHRLYLSHEPNMQFGRARRTRGKVGQKRGCHCNDGRDHFPDELKHSLNNENYTNHLSYAESWPFFFRRIDRFLNSVSFSASFVSSHLMEWKETRRKFRRPKKKIKWLKSAHKFIMENGRRIRRRSKKNIREWFRLGFPINRPRHGNTMGKKFRFRWIEYRLMLIE